MVVRPVAVTGCLRLQGCGVAAVGPLGYVRRCPGRASRDVSDAGRRWCAASVGRGQRCKYIKQCLLLRVVLESIRRLIQVQCTRNWTTGSSCAVVVPE